MSREEQGVPPASGLPAVTGWQGELAAFLRALTGLATDGRKLLVRELETMEGETVMRFSEADAAALTAFMRSSPASEQGRVVQGILRRAAALRG